MDAGLQLSCKVFSFYVPWESVRSVLFLPLWPVVFLQESSNRHLPWFLTLKGAAATSPVTTIVAVGLGWLPLFRVTRFLCFSPKLFFPSTVSGC